MRPWAFAALSLCACAPPGAEDAITYLGLDCAEAFDAQKAALIAQPHLVPAPYERAEPYSFYSSDDGRTSYLFTEPGAPGHPAIMMQRAAAGTVTTTGCPYGDRKAYDELHAYLDSLKAWRRQ